MFRLFLITIFIFTGMVSAYSRDYKVIVTTPGYTSVYQYDNEVFAEQVAKDLRITQPIDIKESVCDISTASNVCVTVGQRSYNFRISDEAPVVRLVFDRNRRVFTGVGFNYIDSDCAVYEAPKFKGLALGSIPEMLEKDIERFISDRSQLSTDSSTVFLFEVDIDENGIVHNLVELNGAQKQYSKVIMDQFYDKAVRGWEPAKKDGVPYRALAQIQFELRR